MARCELQWARVLGLNSTASAVTVSVTLHTLYESVLCTLCTLPTRLCTEALGAIQCRGSHWSKLYVWAGLSTLLLVQVTETSPLPLKGLGRYASTVKRGFETIFSTVSSCVHFP